MPTAADAPAALPASLEPEERDMIALMIPATFKSNAAPHAPFVSLRNIHANGGTYDDITPLCVCDDLRLYLYAGNAYTVCAKHRLVDLGRIRRAYATGGRHAR